MVYSVVGAEIRRQTSSLHLYEFVSALQAVPQSPALCLLVVLVVLPPSLSLLLLLLLLAQLQPRVFELSRQRRNHPVVGLLLLLVMEGEEEDTSHADTDISQQDDVLRAELDTSSKQSHQHNVLVLLQRRGEFSDLLTQGGAVFLSNALSQCLPTEGVGWSLERGKKTHCDSKFPTTAACVCWPGIVRAEQQASVTQRLTGKSPA